MKLTSVIQTLFLISKCLGLKRWVSDQIKQLRGTVIQTPGNMILSSSLHRPPHLCRCIHTNTKIKINPLKRYFKILLQYIQIHTSYFLNNDVRKLLKSLFSVIKAWYLYKRRTFFIQSITYKDLNS